MQSTKTVPAGAQKISADVIRGIEDITIQTVQFMEERLAATSGAHNFRLAIPATEVSGAMEALREVAKRNKFDIELGVLLKNFDQPIIPSTIGRLEADLVKAVEAKSLGEANLAEIKSSIRAAFDGIWNAHNKRASRMQDWAGDRALWNALDDAVTNFRAAARSSGGEISAKARSLTDAEIKTMLAAESARNIAQDLLKSQGLDGAWRQLSKRIRSQVGEKRYEVFLTELKKTEVWARSGSIKKLLENSGLAASEIEAVLGAERAVGKRWGATGVANALKQRQVDVLNEAVKLRIPPEGVRPVGQVAAKAAWFWRWSGILNLETAVGGSRLAFDKLLAKRIESRASLAESRVFQDLLQASGERRAAGMTAGEYMYRARGGWVGRHVLNARTAAAVYYIGIPVVSYLGEKLGLIEEAPAGVVLPTRSISDPVQEQLQTRVSAEMAKDIASIIAKVRVGPDGRGHLLPFQQVEVARLLTRLSKRQLETAYNNGAYTDTRQLGRPSREYSYRAIQGIVEHLAANIHEHTRLPGFLGANPYNTTPRQRRIALYDFVDALGKVGDSTAVIDAFLTKMMPEGASSRRMAELRAAGRRLRDRVQEIEAVFENAIKEQEKHDKGTNLTLKDREQNLKRMREGQDLIRDTFADTFIRELSSASLESYLIEARRTMDTLNALDPAGRDLDKNIWAYWQNVNSPEAVARTLEHSSQLREGLPPSVNDGEIANFLYQMALKIQPAKRDEFITWAIGQNKRGVSLSDCIRSPASKFLTREYLTPEALEANLPAFKGWEGGLLKNLNSYIRSKVPPGQQGGIADELAALYRGTVPKRYQNDIDFIIELMDKGADPKSAVGILKQMNSFPQGQARDARKLLDGLMERGFEPGAPATERALHHMRVLITPEKLGEATEKVLPALQPSMDERQIIDGIQEVLFANRQLASESWANARDYRLVFMGDLGTGMTRIIRRDSSSFEDFGEKVDMLANFARIYNQRNLGKGQTIEKLLPDSAARERFAKHIYTFQGSPILQGLSPKEKAEALYVFVLTRPTLKRRRKTIMPRDMLLKHINTKFEGKTPAAKEVLDAMESYLEKNPSYRH